MSQNAEDDPIQAGASSPVKRATDSGLRARQRVIGAGLKRLYDDVVDERVPDDFQALLDRFDSDREGAGG